MKRIFVSLSLVVVAITIVSCKKEASNKIDVANVKAAATRDEAAKALAVMTFEKSEHDFGTIVGGIPQETIFSFTNTGEAPLIITNVTSSCGCTVPEYPKKPIAPGEKGDISVKFNGSGQNQVTKSITVRANTAKGSEIIKIKAFVTPKKEALTPLKNLKK